MSAPAVIRPPRVSVIVPCYNQARYLAGCLDSALSQGVDVDVVLINDGSPDDTAAVAARYAGRINYVEQANGGLASARNRGIAIARGEYLSFLDSDDELSDGALRAFLTAADARPSAAALCGGHQHIDVDGRPVGPARAAPSFLPDAYHALLAGNRAPPCAYLFRADAVARAGGFDADPSLYGHEDWALLLAIAANGGEVECVPEVVARYRVTGQSMTSTGALRMFASGIEVLERYRTHHGPCDRCKAIVRASLGERVKFWIIEHLMRSERRAALRRWASDAPTLARGGLWGFLLAVPLLATAPTALLARRWRRK